MTFDIATDNIRQPLWRVVLGFGPVITGEQAVAIGDILEDLAVSVFLHNNEATDGDRWSVTLDTAGPPDTAEIYRRLDLYAQEAGIDGLISPADITVGPVPQADWLQQVHDTFPPITVGRFFIYGSHYTGDIPQELTPLKIDAATAFGSGEHETTKGCLLAFEQIAAENPAPDTVRRALDMGCGSGILAIGIAKIWPDSHITAIDIDPESVAVTNRHAGMNNAESAITAAAGNGYAAPETAQNGPYDLIAANILADPLIAMAPDLDHHLRPGGYAVLSGLLGRQEEAVTQAHTNLGLLPAGRFALGEWRALVFRKKP